MHEREKTYWWHTGRLAIIDAWMSRFVKSKNIRILNIGCGTGGTVPTLEKYGTVYNIDVSEEAIKFMRKSGYNANLVESNKLPKIKSDTYDLVVAFDVLEHIKNEQEALNEWSRVLKKNGMILLTVPAYQWLWSGHDLSLHHFRRYTRSRVKAVMPKTLSPVRTSYAILFSLPLIVVFRMITKLLRKNVNSETSYVHTPVPLNYLFTLLLHIEAHIHRYLTLPAGTSVIALFRKNSGD